MDGWDGGSPIAAHPLSFSEKFEKVCPYYISFGMTYEQFWDGDVEMTRAYHKAHKLKTEHEDELAWVQGMYVYMAVGALAPALKAFAKGKIQPYVEQPFTHQERRKAEERAAKRMEEQERKNKAKVMMEVWAINFNEKWEKGQKEKAMNGGEDNGG